MGVLCKEAPIPTTEQYSKDSDDEKPLLSVTLHSLTEVSRGRGCSAAQTPAQVAEKPPLLGVGGSVALAITCFSFLTSLSCFPPWRNPGVSSARGSLVARPRTGALRERRGAWDDGGRLRTPFQTLSPSPGIRIGEESCRRGVWLGRHTCYMATLVS